jgi:hypothetical protein
LHRDQGATVCDEPAAVAGVAIHLEKVGLEGPDNE